MCWKSRRNHLAKVPSVPYCESAGPINPDNILVIVPNLHNGSCLVPFGWMVTSLVLNPDCVRNFKRFELMILGFQFFNLYG